jgi:alpha-beta hydrolase superfamily lysophospholipase
LWSADGSPQGVIVAVHGLGSHVGRFEVLARYVTSQGWALWAFDLPGHGRSPGSQGRVDSFAGLLVDMAVARRDVRDRLGGLPQVMLGQSMGGNLVINYALRRQQIEPQTDSLAGLILAAPMLLPPNPPRRPHIFAAWLTGHLLPRLCIDRPVDPSALTSVADEARAIRNDPLMHSRISVYLGTQLLAQGRWALDHARQIDIPTLVLHGEEDRLIDRSACEHLPIRIGDLATSVSFPQQRHDLFHDRGSAAVLACIGVWLEQFRQPGP